MHATPAEDAATRYYLERTLLGYRLAGVDRDEATRDRIRALADRMTELSMTFSRTVQDDVRTITVDDPNDSPACPRTTSPAMASRRASGRQARRRRPVVLTTDPPDMSPGDELRRQPRCAASMYLAYNDRGYPANKQVLLDLLAAREEMAELLGFRSWADLATVDQMMGSAANMRSFLNEVEAAARETAQARVRGAEAFVASAIPTRCR